MGDPFSAGLAALHASPLAEDAEHVSIYGQITRGLRVIRSRGDGLVRLGEAQIISGTQSVQIRKAQLPELFAGDQLMIGHIDDGLFVMTEELVLTGEPMSDEEGLSWTIGADELDVGR